ncbi:MAG: hypothetical protein KA352_07275 [Flavobacteriales bacterium]|nr:hypothetical protein [Flavobacteriales bacterium]
MSLVRPLCARTFAHPDQPHNCRPSDVDKVIGHLSGDLAAVVDSLLDLVSPLKGVRIEGASGSLMVKAPATFLSIRPRSKDIQVSFILDEELDVFPITKNLRLSKHRVAHAVHPDAPDGLDRQLIHWIHRAHALSIARKARHH